MEEIYKSKYYKYKTKYLKYKKLVGGDYKNSIIKYIIDKGSVISRDFNNIDQTIFNLNNLFITHDLETIKDIYEKYGYLQIRKYNNEKKLIIGCGNRRLDNRNLDKCLIESSCNQIHENIYHSHNEAFTIDMTILANPSIIGEFAPHINFSSIPDNSFDMIIFEGGGEPKVNPDEIKRLLNKNNYSFCICQDDYGKDMIYSTWRDGKYSIL